MFSFDPGTSINLLSIKGAKVFFPHMVRLLPGKALPSARAIYKVLAEASVLTSLYKHSCGQQRKVVVNESHSTGSAKKT